MKMAIVRGALIYLVLDGLLAYVAARILSDQQGTDWGLVVGVFAAIWLVSAMVAVRRWIYSGITAYFAQSDLAELYRRRMVEAGVPAPPVFDSLPDNYLSQVAEDGTLPDSARLGAMAILCEITQALGYKGFVVGYFIRAAAGEALNRLR